MNHFPALLTDEFKAPVALEDEDEKFKRYLQENGYDISRMGLKP